MALLSKDTRKKEWLDSICKDFPSINSDKLKRHFVENMIDAYLADEKKFKEVTNQLKKENTDVFKKAPDEVIGITRIEAEEPNKGVTIEEIENVE